MCQNNQKRSKRLVATGESKRLKVEEAAEVDNIVLEHFVATRVSKRPQVKTAPVEVNKMLEIEWTTHDDETDDPIKWNMFEDEIGDDDLKDSRAILENWQDESGDYSLDLKLVDGKSLHRNTLASLKVDYWPLGANLQQFDQHSQALGNFCYYLWDVSGGDIDTYFPLDVEFHYSPYSFIEVRTLVEEATDEDWCQAVMYVSCAGRYENSGESRELLNAIFGSIAALMVVHETDLEALGLHSLDEYKALGFVPIQGGWFVGRTF